MRRSLLCFLALSWACDPAPTADGGSSTSGGTSSSGAESSDSSSSSTSSDSEHSSTSGQESTTTSSGSSSGSGSSSTGRTACDGLVPGEAFEIAAGDSSTRVHPHAAIDEQGAWFTYARPEPAGSNFEIALTHFRCATDVDVPPLVVNTAAGNHIDPSVAVSDDRVIVVWNSDDGTGGSSNLQIHYRTFELDGTPIDAQQQRLTTAVDGVDITQNHTFGKVTARADGFTIGGLRAHPQSPAFVAFAQVLDLDGAFVGEAYSAPIEAGISHLDAAAAGDWLVFQRSADDDSVRTMELSTAQPGPSLPDASGGALLPPTVGSGNAPIIAATRSDLNTPYVSVLVEGSPANLIGAAPQHNPSLATNDDNVFGVVFHRNQGGLDNRVVMQRLSTDGSATRMLAPFGDEVVLDDESPPYPPSIAWVGTGWLVTWSRGSSPNFTTWGQVIEP